MKRHKYLSTISSKITLFFLYGIMQLNTVSASFTDLEQDPYPLVFLQKNLTRILVNDNISPVVATRNYVYPQLAAFYILSLNDTGRNIFAAIRHFPAVPAKLSVENYSSSLAASYAFFEVAEKLIYTHQPFTDSFSVLLDWYRHTGMDTLLFRSSREAGKEVAKSIIEWMNQDGFNETRLMNKYILLKEPGKWQATYPGYFAAIEPHWGRIRPMVLTDKNQLDQFLPMDFDTTKNSFFYKEALHVYEVSKELTVEQKKIASFWDCNPFALKPMGHINTFVKKISPGGHWMNIAGIACTDKQFTLAQTSRVLTLCAVSLFDALIYTWDKKYQYSYLRPETFIEQVGMDDNWQPYIQSPPFPEFPSGHAVISNTAAAVLTALFGNSFFYVDDSETEFGLESRQFPSFQAAADEATISRVYGGIHFLFSCNIGQEMGKLMGDKFVATVLK